MQDDERAIRDLIATWLEASKAGDTEKVLSLMADDVVFLVTGHPPMRGRPMPWVSSFFDRVWRDYGRSAVTEAKVAEPVA